MPPAQLLQHEPGAAPSLRTIELRIRGSLLISPVAAASNHASRGHAALAAAERLRAAAPAALRSGAWRVEALLGGLGAGGVAISVDALEATAEASREQGKYPSGIVKLVATREM